MKIYFDNVLIDEDNYAELTKSGKVYDGYFKIGSTICENYKLRVNKDAVEEIPEKVYLYDDETLLKTLYVIDFKDENDNYITLNLEDAMTKFNFRYDASKIFNQQGYTTLGAIFDDICEKAGVQSDINDFRGYNLRVSWYDNTYMARDYLSYIAEKNVKNFRISANDKLEFVDIVAEPVKQITFDEISNYKIGTEHVITKVVLGDWQYGNDTGETYYINEDNVYITSQEDVQYIYNIIDGFTYYNFKTNDCPMNDLNVGDLVDFENHLTFIQYENLVFSGGNWFGGISVELENKEQQSTKIVGEEDRYRRIKRIVDYDSGRIDQIIETTPVISTETNGIGRLRLDNLMNTKLIELRIHPTDKDILGLFASPLLKASTNLKALSRGITFDGETDYYYKLPENLYYLGDIYDEFVYDGLNEKIYIIHRIGIENDEKYVLENEELEEIEYYDIIIGEGDYDIFMASYPTAYIYIKAMIKNEYTQSFTTTYEAGTKFSQTEKAISILAEEKTDNNKIIAEINTAIEDGQGIINLKGNSVIIDSDFFKLNADGSIEATRGTFSGTIETEQDCKVGNYIILGEPVAYDAKGIIFSRYPATSVYILYSLMANLIDIRNGNNSLLIGENSTTNEQNFHNNGKMYLYDKLYAIDNNRTSSIELDNQTGDITCEGNVNCGNITSHSLEYWSGDVFSIKTTTGQVGRPCVAGWISNNATEFNFSVITPKSMKYVTPSLRTLGLNVRKANGGYVGASGHQEGGTNFMDASFSKYITKTNDNMINILVRINSGQFSNITNNTPLAIEINNLEIVFN